MRHKFSKEIIYHFNCGKCNKWWSISDYHLLSNDTSNSEETVPKLVICPQWLWAPRRSKRNKRQNKLILEVFIIKKNAQSKIRYNISICR